LAGEEILQPFFFDSSRDKKIIPHESTIPREKIKLIQKNFAG